MLSLASHQIIIPIPPLRELPLQTKLFSMIGLIQFFSLVHVTPGALRAAHLRPYIVSSCFILFHLVSFAAHLRPYFEFHLVSSCFILFHLVSFCFISFHLGPICARTLAFHLVSSCFISFHLVSSCFMCFIWGEDGPVNLARVPSMIACPKRAF